MKRSEFIKILEEKAIKYEIRDNIIYVLGNIFGNVYLNLIDSIPENIQFNNGGNVHLNFLKSLPENIQFNNSGSVYLDSLMSMPESTQFNNGINVDLSLLKSLPENIQFNNGGQIILKNRKLEPEKDYIKRYKLKVNDGKVILYKRVSKDFLTQTGKPWETHWKIGSTLVHPNWNPGKNECGPGKFHACARPFWCEFFRNRKGDKYIAIEIKVKDLFEWKKERPVFPQKIAFRCGKVLYECDRYGNKT